MENVIEARGLTRRFGKKEAVRDLSFTVPSGGVFAFLGPNGAGKTTTIKLAMNILEPTRGHIAVLGKDSTQLGPPELAQIGYVSENQKLPEWMTVSQLVDYCRPFYPNWDEQFCKQLASDLSLPPHEKIKNLSRGMKVKAALLCSLAYRPRLLVLDEPFGGLDPLVRDDLVRGILEMTEQGQWTIFISSHDVDEVEALADWVGFLNEGRIIFVESIAQLQSRFRRVEVITQGDAFKPAQIPPTWLNPEVAGRTFRFVDSAYGEPDSVDKIKSEYGASEVSVSSMSLRDIFVALAKNSRLSGWSEQWLT